MENHWPVGFLRYSTWYACMGTKGNDKCKIFTKLIVLVSTTFTWLPPQAPNKTQSPWYYLLFPVWLLSPPSSALGPSITPVSRRPIFCPSSIRYQYVIRLLLEFGVEKNYYWVTTFGPSTDRFRNPESGTRLDPFCWESSLGLSSGRLWNPESGITLGKKLIFFESLFQSLLRPLSEFGIRNCFFRINLILLRTTVWGIWNPELFFFRT